MPTKSVVTVLIACGFAAFSPATALAGNIGFPEGQGLLIDHQPYNFGGLTSDSMGFETPGSPTVYQYVADDLSLPFGGTVRRIVYHGFFNSAIAPSGGDAYQIRLYWPRPGDGLPGDVYYETTAVNPPRVWTGRNVIAFGGGPELRFQVDLDVPVEIPAGQLLWLSIYQANDPLSSFRWESSDTPPLDGQAFNNANFSNWTHTVSITSNAAFELYSIPEPGSFSLLILGAIILSKSIARRVVRRASRR